MEMELDWNGVPCIVLTTQVSVSVLYLSVFAQLGVSKLSPSKTTEMHYLVHPITHDVDTDDTFHQ